METVRYSARGRQPSDDCRRHHLAALRQSRDRKRGKESQDERDHHAESGRRAKKREQRNPVIERQVESGIRSERGPGQQGAERAVEQEGLAVVAAGPQRIGRLGFQPASHMPASPSNVDTMPGNKTSVHRPTFAPASAAIGARAPTRPCSWRGSPSSADCPRSSARSRPPVFRGTG